MLDAPSARPVDTAIFGRGLWKRISVPAAWPGPSSPSLLTVCLRSRRPLVKSYAVVPRRSKSWPQGVWRHRRIRVESAILRRRDPRCGLGSALLAHLRDGARLHAGGHCALCTPRRTFHEHGNLIDQETAALMARAGSFSGADPGNL